MVYGGREGDKKPKQTIAHICTKLPKITDYKLQVLQTGTKIFFNFLSKKISISV